MKRFSLIPFVGIFLLAAGSAASACSSSDGSSNNGNNSAGSSGDAGPSDSGGASGSAGSDGAGECVVDQDCAAKLPETTPVGCAEAKCNRLQKRCEFLAKDADGDGHRAIACSGGLVAIQTGDDCNDGDPNTYPGAWDGPGDAPAGSGGSAGASGGGSAGAGGDSTAGAGGNSATAGAGGETAGAAGAAQTPGTGGAPSGETRPDRCDQIDQDCDGTPDNAKNGAKSCKCDPAHPNPCFEYPNGVPIDSKLMNVGICKQGTQSCVDGVPGACIGAIGPTTETCNEVDDDCNGEEDDGSVNAVEICPDLDKDYSCVLTDGAGNNKCKMGCNATGYRVKNLCTPGGNDCNDGNSSIKLDAKELCGDNEDTNCNGDKNDGYGDLGQPCTAGTTGACRHAGTRVCVQPSRDSTACSVSGDTPKEFSSSMSTGPVDMSTARSDYDPRWDHNCNNAIETDVPGHADAFRSTACHGTAAAACANFTNETDCRRIDIDTTGLHPLVILALLGTKYYSCATSGGFYLPMHKLCGQPFNGIQCIWEDGKCTGNAINGTRALGCK